MKIQRVFANNRRKAFVIQTRRGQMEFPYSQLRLKPTRDDSVASVQADPELGSECFTYELASGKSDSIPLDAVLDYNKDPDYLREILLHTLSIKAQDIVRKRNIPKRELCRRLKTSPTQLYRLLDQAYYRKSIDEMVRLLVALGQRIEIVVKNAA